MANLFILTTAGATFAAIYEWIAINILKKTALVVFSYKLHHSLYGIACIILAALLNQTNLIFFGLGIIIQHTFTDGFKFISKHQSKKP